MHENQNCIFIRSKNSPNFYVFTTTFSFKLCFKKTVNLFECVAEKDPFKYFKNFVSILSLISQGVGQTEDKGHNSAKAKHKAKQLTASQAGKKSSFKKLAAY